MIHHVTTKTGFECQVNDAACTDIRFVRATADVMRYTAAQQDVTTMTRLSDAVGTLEQLLIPNDTERLYDHIKSYREDFVPIDALMLELNDIIEAATPKK